MEITWPLICFMIAHCIQGLMIINLRNKLKKEKRKKTFVIIEGATVKETVVITDED